MPFSPSDISGLKIWLKADAGAGTSDGDPVGTWTDQSGTSHNFTQSGTKRPTYKTNIRRGLPVVRFDGSDDQLDGGDLSALFSTGATVFAAFAETSGTTLAIYSTHVSNDSWWSYSGAGYLGVFRSSRLENTPSSGMPTSGWNVWAIRATSSNSYKAWIDGVSKIDSSASFTFGGGTAHMLGKQNFLGYYDFLDFGELIVYDSALSDADRIDVQNYLKGRWIADVVSGVVLTTTPSLPAGKVTIPVYGTALSVTPSLPAGTVAAANQLQGVVLTVTPSLPAGAVRFTRIYGVALTTTPSLPAGGVTAPIVGVALQVTPSLPAGLLRFTRVYGIPLTVAPSMPAGSLTVDTAVVGVALVVTPHPVAGALHYGGSPTGATDSWTVEIQPADGGVPDLSDAAFRMMRLVWTVDMGGSASAEIDLREDQVSAAWAPGFHRLIVRGPRDWAGDITQLSRSGSPDGEYKIGYKASALGLVHRLDYRIVRHDLTVNDEAAVIVEALLSEAQDNQFNGNMGFTFGTVVGTTVTRRRNYCVGVGIGDAIRELAEVGRGFDWEIDPDGQLNIWNNTRGIDTGKTLAETDVQRWDIELDTSELLTNVTAIADPSDPFGPKYRMSRTAMADDYGRREVSIDTDVIAHNDDNPNWEDELYDAGRALLKVGGGGFLRLRAMWLSDRAPWPIGDVWLQDWVTVTLPAYFGGNTLMRCTDVAVTLEPMPPRGVDAPIYFVEYGFDALVTDLDITDGDPDQES